MKFIKKVSLTSWFVLATLIFTLVGFISYLVNTKTTYFFTFGVSPAILTFAIIALILEIAYIASDFFKDSKQIIIAKEVVSVIIPILIICALIYLLDARIYYSATILTYEKTTQNVSDLSSALVAIGSLGLAFLMGVVSSFIPRKQKEN